MRGFTYRVQLSETIREFTVGNASSVAALIFQSVAGTAPDALDRVIYHTDLAALAFDPAGAVTPRPHHYS